MYSKLMLRRVTGAKVSYYPQAPKGVLHLVVRERRVVARLLPLEVFGDFSRSVLPTPYVVV
jgi:hypothetical protein